MFRKIEQTWLVISINNIIILLLLRTFSHVFEIISQTFFFCLTLKKTCVWSHCGERFAVQRINRTLLPLWVVVFFFSSETMENGFKSHVSYFTLWQVLQASPYKWWLLKVRGIRKRQIACSPCLSFFFFFLIAGVLNLLPALLLLMRFFFRVRFTLKVRAVKSQSALPCDTHIFLLLLLLIVPPPPIYFFSSNSYGPKVWRLMVFRSVCAQAKALKIYSTYAAKWKTSHTHMSTLIHNFQSQRDPRKWKVSKVYDEARSTISRRTCHLSPCLWPSRWCSNLAHEKSRAEYHKAQASKPKSSSTWHEELWSSGLDIPSFHWRLLGKSCWRVGRNRGGRREY